jgi:hypothetical protein
VKYGDASINTTQIYTLVESGRLLGMVHMLESGIDEVVTGWSLQDAKKKSKAA